MRCPKCGYFSFDHLESCRKCKKNIMDTAMELNGTMYNVIPPSFLKIVMDDDSDAASDEGQWVEGAESNSADALESETTLFAEGVFEPSGQAVDAASEGEDDLDGVDLEEALGTDSRQYLEAVPDASDSDDEVREPPPMNFGDLDITDLAPPTQDESMEKEPALALADGSSQEAGVAGDGQEKKAKSSGLADLQLDGLNLDKRSLTTGAMGKRNLQDVKTGTALDKFDIDLGDLFDDPKDTQSK